MSPETLDHPELGPWLAGIRARPGDTLPILVFADWLREHGEWEAGEAVANCRTVGEVEAVFTVARFASALVTMRQAWGVVAEQAAGAMRDMQRAFGVVAADLAETLRRAAPQIEELQRIAAAVGEEKPVGKKKK